MACLLFPDCDILRGIPTDIVEQLGLVLSTAIAEFEYRYKTAKLLYDSSRDGANAAAFHSHCDDQGPTLTLIKDTDSNVFGGYTTISWRSHDIVTSARDPAAFLVRVVSPHGGPPIVFPSTAKYQSVISNSRYGPWFCHGINVCYDDDCDCYTNVDGMEYSNPTGLSSGETMTGRWKFKPAHIQVYSL